MNYPYRILHPSEHHPCFVGSGECLIPATHATDDGTGTEVFMCAFHREEFEIMEKRVAKLSAHKYEQLEAYIEAAHRDEALAAHKREHGTEG